MPFPYTPNSDDELLYHYCSPEAFLAICTGRTLRFGDLAHMNDSSEGKWGYDIWIEVANQLIPELGKPFVHEVDRVVHETGFRGVPLGACLSQDEDVLSQWRAYAADGAGYAVGFAATALTQAPAVMLKVVYDPTQQVEEVVQYVRALHRAEQGKWRPRFGGDLETVCRGLALGLFSYKNPAFSEEREVRLIRALVASPSGAYVRVDDVGEGDRPALEVGFRIVRGAPTPYLDVDISDGGQLEPIRRIVLGPRNGAPESAVTLFLETVGLSRVEVVRSTAPYR